ncbi:MAG: hypothetical protein NT062_05815 [Proteobacteria bacterium]|nr:hypothetical protein [Pseudomonadota bacterium]
MTSSMQKSPADISGMEYDWLGCDSNGCMALFTTAGAGYAPAEFLCDTEAHDIAIRAVLALPATTEARFFPRVAAGLVNTWRLVAERGLYAYDCDPTGGPYRLVAAPVLAIQANAIPPAIAAVATEVRCPDCFLVHVCDSGGFYSHDRDAACVATCRGAGLSALRDSLERLFGFLAEQGLVAPTMEVWLVEIRSWADVDDRGRPRVRRADLRPPEAYEARFDELLAAGYAWINMSCYGLLRGGLVVVIETPRETRSRLSRVSVNLSGPPNAARERGWDVDEVLAIT